MLLAGNTDQIPLLTKVPNGLFKKKILKCTKPNIKIKGQTPKLMITWQTLQWPCPCSTPWADCTHLPTKAGYSHQQRSVLIRLRGVLYTSLQHVHKHFSRVPLFTEWLTVPKLLGPLQPLTGQRTACWVKVTSPKTAWAKLLRWGLTDSCSQGWISRTSYLDSSLQIKVRPAETHQLLSIDPLL